MSQRRRGRRLDLRRDLGRRLVGDGWPTLLVVAFSHRGTGTGAPGHRRPGGVADPPMPLGVVAVGGGAAGAGVGVAVDVGGDARSRRRSSSARSHQLRWRRIRSSPAVASSVGPGGSGYVGAFGSGGGPRRPPRSRLPRYHRPSCRRSQSSPVAGTSPGRDRGVGRGTAPTTSCSGSGGRAWGPASSCRHPRRRPPRPRRGQAASCATRGACATSPT